ncbi:MAG TPA: diguanylate cyclase [Gemmatimonadales bacterium]|nr:diguanylate cyclase [Gemmatimonadales bacterium]
MSVWGDRVARPLRALHLDTIRNKILALVVLATLIPTLATTINSYGRNRRALSETVDQELRGTSSEAARALDQWLDERLDELHVSASSYVLSDNVGRTQGSGADRALGRLRDHLTASRERFPAFETLLIIDATGRGVASSGGRTGAMSLPLERLNALRTGDAHIGEPYWDVGLARAAIVLAVPIRQADGRFLGALSAKISLRSVADTLARLAPAGAGEITVMTDRGRLILTSRTSTAELMRTNVPETTTQLLAKEGTTGTYERAGGPEVVAIARRVPQLRWAAIVEVPRDEAFADLARLRNGTILMLFVLVVAVGLIAYGLGMLIARPLERLSAAAAKVTSGDLSAELPAGGSGEVGYLTRAFAQLVSRLREREGQTELERLSVTDALTGLYNRRHLMGTLANEVQRSRRLRRTFSVLMADVDHFKRYNDTNGHLGGDAALVKVAEILRKATRGVDSVARYGGEEFLIMLLEAPLATAAIVAERIRARVASEPFEGGKVTVSIGIAEYPSHGDTPEELIASADAAMYRSKSQGRDQVVVASGGLPQEPAAERKPRRRKGET